MRPIFQHTENGGIHLELSSQLYKPGHLTKVHTRDDEANLNTEVLTLRAPQIVKKLPIGEQPLKVATAPDHAVGFPTSRGRCVIIDFGLSPYPVEPIRPQTIGAPPLLPPCRR